MDKEKIHKSNKRKIVVSAVIAVIAIALGGSLWCYLKVTQKYSGEDTRIYIPHGSDDEAIADTLTINLGEDFGSTVYDIWRLRRKDSSPLNGSYVARKGMSAFDMSRKLVSGKQDPIRFTFNNLRTLDQLAARIDDKLELTSSEFLAACDSVLSLEGMKKEEFPAAFMPDTYDFYWDASPDFVVKTLYAYRNRFWNDERKAKAELLGLSPIEVATVASIVEEETVKPDERPKVARLYLNRLNRGMKLQADPTVKFAIGDFGLRRITGTHLAADSPYNTYKYAGLPPGPIRIPDGRAIDAVLSAPMHPYIYMCAKEDFSGYHNFAASGTEHMANARRYHRALNQRGIK